MTTTRPYEFHRSILPVLPAPRLDALPKTDTDDIEQGLNRLRENPELLRTKDGISPDFSLYRVREHFLVCTLSADRVYVLTIKHGSMDLPRRLTELEPQLLAEAELLRRALDKKRNER